jgi:ApaG protein
MRFKYPFMIQPDQKNTLEDYHKNTGNPLRYKEKSGQMPRMEEINQHGVVIQTQVNYLPEQSDEAGNRFVFSYTITITNLGQASAKLISRHWIITDAHNHVQEVRGQGVVGEQPLLKPSQSFEYTSGTVLTTQVGTMRGSYQMQTEDGSQFEVEIPQFVLSVPRVLH